MRKNVIFCCILTLLVSCNTIDSKRLNFSINKKEKSLITKNDFESQLSLNYFLYSRSLLEKKLVKDAKYFYNKGTEAKNNNDDKLLKIDFGSKKIFSENSKFQLLEYKNRLITLVDKNNLKEVYPIKVAELYFNFNCWNYYDITEINTNQASYCKKEFVNLISKLEREFSEKSNVFYKEENDELIQLTPQERQKFYNFNNKNTTNIYFDLNSFKLNAKALEDIKVFLKYLSTIKEDYYIEIRGNTDRSGNVFYNNDLAIKRARTVYNIIVKNGVPAKYVTITNKSSKDPLIITKDQDVNALNRRVEVEIKRVLDRKIDLMPQPLK